MDMSTATQAYLEECLGNWRNRPEQKRRNEKTGRRMDSTALFARHIGVSLNTVNNWLLRAETPTKASAQKISGKFGPKIWELIGEPEPDPLLDVVIRNWGRLPDAVKTEIVETVERAEARGAVGEGRAGVAIPKRRRAQSN